MSTMTAVFCTGCGKIVYASPETGGKCNLCGTEIKPKSAAGAAEKAPKVCVVCGADVTKKKRMKDSQGKYFCYECGIADQKRKETTESFACADCGRAFAKEKMYSTDGTFRCKRCYGVRMFEYKEAKAAAEEKALAAKREKSKAQKWKKVGLLVLGNGLLVLFILYQAGFFESE